MKDGKLRTKALFELFDKWQDEFLDTDLLDAMFTHIWKEERRMIMYFIFYPFLLYFIVALVYYYECLLKDVQSPYRERSINISSIFCEIWSTGDCDWGTDAEPYLREVFLFLLVPQIIVEVF